MEHEQNKGMEDLFEDIAEGMGYSKENRQKRGRSSDVSISTMRKHLFLWGASVLVLSVLLALFFSGSCSSKKQIASIQTRLDLMEQRLVSLEQSGKRLETLESQQNRYKASVAEIRELIRKQGNKTTELSKNLAELKQALSSSPQKKGDNGSVSGEKPPAAGLHHTISRGETLYGIAKKYNLSLEELLKLNGIEKDYILKPGQKLLIAPVNR